jgi:hypothetical protein
LTITPSSNLNFNVTNSIWTASPGSNSAPSLTFSGNTSTGIFFPSTNTVAISTAATEALRVDSSGRVGIGTTSPIGVLDVRGDVYLGSTIVGVSTYARTAANWNYSTFNVIRNSSNASTTKAIEFSYDGDAIGNTSIGGTNAIWSFTNGTSPTTGSTTSGLQSGLTYAAYYGHRWNVNGTEAMRIDSSGNVLLNRATQISSEKFGIEVSGSTQFAYLRSTGTSGNPTLFRIASGVFSGGIGASGNFIYCEDGGSSKFYVLGNGGIANYSASNTNLSDRREKTNFAPAGEYLSKICNIPVQTFNFIDQNLEEDGDLTLGVVAQDVQAVAPELITESNWGTEEAPKMRLSIYQTDLQYALMKCIQEQQALITQLQADVAALKAQ